MSKEFCNKDLLWESDYSDGDISSQVNLLQLLVDSASESGDEILREQILVESKLSDKGMRAECQREADDLPETLDASIEERESLGEKQRHTAWSETDRILLNNLATSVRQGNIYRVESALRALAENHRSAERILRRFAEDLTDESPRNSAVWEQGHDSNGDFIIRLRLIHAFSEGGNISISIGSDSRHIAASQFSHNAILVPETLKRAIRHFRRTN